MSQLNPKQLKSEIRQLVTRLDPIMSEYFDGFMLVGIRAGTPDAHACIMIGNQKKVKAAAISAVAELIKEDRQNGI